MSDVLSDTINSGESVMLNEVDSNTSDDEELKREHLLKTQDVLIDKAVETQQELVDKMEETRKGMAKEQLDKRIKEIAEVAEEVGFLPQDLIQPVEPVIHKEHIAEVPDYLPSRDHEQKIFNKKKVKNDGAAVRTRHNDSVIGDVAPCRGTVNMAGKFLRN